MLGLDSDQTVRLLYLSMLLAFVLGGIGYRRGLRRAGFQHLVIWAVLLLALVTVYAYRAPLLRFAEPVLGELYPSRAAQVTGPNGNKELRISRAPDGHFHIDADVNGTSVRFLVDTGASSTVLTEGDADQVGINTSVLQFTRPVQTANGIAFYAPARVESLAIGPVVLTDVPVGVMPSSALSSSLLGMNTLNRFTGWRVDNDQMTLVP